MKIPSSYLTENDKENMSVFASHFKKLISNHKPTDNEVIHKIDLREIMTELDTPSAWANFAYTAKKLTNNKAPVLNNVPLNAFKVITGINLRRHSNFITELWEGNVDFKEWHEG